MRVFAPAPFRYPPQTGKDYAYGWQDVADDTLARTLVNAGFMQTGDAGPDPWQGSQPGSAAVAAASRFAQKLRAGYAAGRSQNPHKNLPILSAPPRAPSTAYACVGAIFSSSGNLYQVQTAGTTSAAASISTTGTALITDGTCKVYYIGPDKGSTTAPLRGTVSTFTAGLTAATGGTLSAAITAGSYLAQFQTGETRVMTVADAGGGTGTAATWTGAILSAASTFQYWPISQVVGTVPILSFNTWSAYAGLATKVYYDKAGAFFYAGGTPTESGANHGYGSG